MRDAALAFAAKIKLDDDQFSRLLPPGLRRLTPENLLVRLKLEVQRTYAGKLGELAFLALLRDRGIECDTTGLFEVYPGQENTDSFDFALPSGESIDVKTGFRSNHRRLLVNEQQLANIPKDYYVAVKLSAQDAPGDGKLILWDSVESATVKGYAQRGYLERLRSISYGEARAKGVEYDRLMGIDRLLSLFR